MDNKAQKKLEEMDWDKVTMSQVFIVLIIFLFVSEVGQILLFVVMAGLFALLFKVFGS